MGQKAPSDGRRHQGRAGRRRSTYAALETRNTYVMTKPDEQSDTIQGAKTANIQLALSYPIISAFEFEFLKAEEVIRERLDHSTIYLLAQRPLTYFDNVVLQDGAITFEIADGQHRPLACRVDLVDADICAPGEALYVEVAYFIDTPPQPQPYRQVASIKLFRTDGEFIVWWSPQKILFEMLVRGLPVGVADDGEPLSFTDFTVLYIGKAFNQKVWDRLTGHEKMQKILTVQSPVGAGPAARAPFEISLILLKVVGLQEVLEVPYIGASAVQGVTPILHDLDLNDDEALERFMTEPLVPLHDEAMTREAEACLIHRFQPRFNTVKFKSYPHIEGGMRSKGYTWTDLLIEDLPGTLRTSHFEAGPVGEIAFSSDLAE